MITESNPPSDVTALALGASVLRHRRLITLCALLVGAGAAAFTLLFSHRQYAAESRFLPQQSQQGSNARISGLAAQFGLALGPSAAGADESLDFYAELLQSRALLREAAESRYAVPGAPAGAPVPLADLLHVNGSTPGERISAAIRRLSAGLGVQVDIRSGLVQLTTRMPTPDLAVQVNRRMLELVNEFNLQKRQSQARAEREFVQEQLAAAQRELESAEGAVEQFMAENRIEASPRLQFERAKLQRRLDLRQQVYTSLAQSFEQARIDEVRNTPVVTIMEPPEGSVTTLGRGVVRRGIVGTIVGLLLGLALVFFREYIRRAAEEDPAAFREIEAYWRPLRERLGRRREAENRGPGLRERLVPELASRTDGQS